jgi:prepilin-type N-terminal cleavage/methylation domain-containing protein
MSALRRGFTLIELLVVIAILAILVAILLPAVQQARESARQTHCRDNLHNIALALHNYHGTHGRFPPGSTNDVEQGGWIADPLTRHIHSWSSLILPQIEQTTLYRSIDHDVSSMHPNNLPVASVVLPIFRCPSYVGPDYSNDSHYTRFSSQYAITNYAAMGGSDVGHIYGQNTGLYEPDGTIYPLSSTREADVTDGLSNTLLIVETREEKMMVWIDGGTASLVARPYDDGNGPTYSRNVHSLNYRPYFEYTDPFAEWGPSSMHTGGAFHLLGDGVVRFASQSVDDDVYVALSTRAGGEPGGTY